MKTKEAAQSAAKVTFLLEAASGFSCSNEEKTVKFLVVGFLSLPIVERDQGVALGRVVLLADLGLFAVEQVATALLVLVQRVRVVVRQSS